MVKNILAVRQEQWGDPVGTHARIADVWSGILGHVVSARQVALMMSGLKLVRAEISPDIKDSYDDAEGYLNIARLIVARPSEVEALQEKLGLLRKQEEQEQDEVVKYWDDVLEEKLNET